MSKSARGDRRGSDWRANAVDEYIDEWRRITGWEERKVKIR